MPQVCVNCCAYSNVNMYLKVNSLIKSFRNIFVEMIKIAYTVMQKHYIEFSKKLSYYFMIEKVNKWNNSWVAGAGVANVGRDS